MQLYFVEFAVRRLKDRSAKMHGILIIADRREFATAVVAEFKKVARSNGGLVHVHEKLGEIFKPDVIVQNDDEDWDLVSIMTAEEVEASRLQGKTRALQNKCRSTSVEVPAEILAVLARAEQS